MEISEYNDTMRQMAEQVNSIVHNQRVLADVNSELDRNQNNPFEQDYIYQDQYGSIPSNPIERTIGGVQITTRILHQTGQQLSDVVGADLLYEIKDTKYILVQYKRVPVDSPSFTVDPIQLKKVIGNCPSICLYRRNKPTSVPTVMNGYCGCFYRIISTDESKFLPACEIDWLSSASNSIKTTLISSGLSTDTFEELFAFCRIGALTRVKRSNAYIDEYLGLNHIIYYALQNGQW